MQRFINNFSAAMVLLTSAACITHPTCSHEQMIAMKDNGFDPSHIETMCMSSRLDFGGITTMVETGIQAWAAAKVATRGADTAATKRDTDAAKLEALADFLSRLNGTDEHARER